MKKIMVTAFALLLVVRMWVPVTQCNGEVRANTCLDVDGEIYILKNSYVDVHEMPVVIYLEKIKGTKYEVSHVEIDWDTFVEDGHNYQF